MAPANSKVSGLMAVASVALTASTTQAFVVATQHRRQRLPVQRLSVQQQRPGEVPSMVLGDYSDTQRIPDQPPSDGQQPLMGHGDFDVIDMLLQLAALDAQLENPGWLCSKLFARFIWVCFAQQ